MRPDAFILGFSIICHATSRLSAWLCLQHPYIGLHPLNQDIRPLPSRRLKMALPSPIQASNATAVAATAADSFELDREYHERLLSGDSENDASTGNSNGRGVHDEEIRTTPLFSADVLKRVATSRPNNGNPSVANILPQYGLLAKVLEKFDKDGGNDQPDSLAQEPQQNRISNINPSQNGNAQIDDQRLFLNMNTPWSTFICGSQGSGKSHTLSCMLEAGLMNASRLGPLPEPLAAMVFHYDKHSSFSSKQVCEAAYLASSGIPVKIMVSPTSYPHMRDVAYANLPRFPSNIPKPLIVPLLLTEQHLNIVTMMRLMAIEEDGRTALYMEVGAINP